MKIYTKTGDDGSTGLFGGARVGKDSLRVEAYGQVDELNSTLGAARALGAAAELDGVLAELQGELFVLGADLATPQGGKQASYLPRVEPAQVTRLEGLIDRYDAGLPALQNFILPGGTPLGSALHLARTVCRRAERATVALARTEPIGEAPVHYLNRLADLLFVLARHANHAAGARETEWAPRKSD